MMRYSSTIKRKSNLNYLEYTKLLGSYKLKKQIGDMKAGTRVKITRVFTNPDRSLNLMFYCIDKITAPVDFQVAEYNFKEYFER